MTSNNYRMLIQYDGTKYRGWQKQGNTADTIQEKFEQLLSKMTGEEIEIHGSGRTDAGVHAAGQTASFKTRCTMSEAEMLDYINHYLPKDIRVLELKKADSRFHARLSAVKKRYVYRVSTTERYDVFSRQTIAVLPGTYDLQAMRKAAELLCGQHDYKSFCDNRHMKKSTVRTISEIRILEKNHEIRIEYIGDGFLYHMVRLLTGTILEVGNGMKNPEEMTQILEAKDRSKAGFLAPASGLCLDRVWY